MSACLRPSYLFKDAVVTVQVVFLPPSLELFLSLCQCIDFCLEDHLFGSPGSHYSAVTPDGSGCSEEGNSFVFISEDK